MYTRVPEFPQLPKERISGKYSDRNNLHIVIPEGLLIRNPASWLMLRNYEQGFQRHGIPSWTRSGAFRGEGFTSPHNRHPAPDSDPGLGPASAPAHSRRQQIPGINSLSIHSDLLSFQATLTFEESTD